MTEELYKKYRPKNFNEVVGQDDAIKVLATLGKEGKIPHTILLSGGSGTGKTTIARILRNKLKCSDIDFQETNAAEDRGIDSIRAIQSTMGSTPLAGKTRVWLLDECHQYTHEASSCLLKLLEDTPKHCYFILATTDPGKLKKTIRTRCTEIKCKPINDTDLENLITSVCDQEEKTITGDVIEKIISVAEGSARQALVSLNTVIGLSSEGEQLASILGGEDNPEAIVIARLILSKTAKWPKVAAALKAAEKAGHEPETLRRIILGYCRTILLGKGNHSQAARIIEEFRDHFYDSGNAGLAVSCYNIIVGD